MNRLTRDGTAEPVSRDQILTDTYGDRTIFIFPVQLTTSRIGNLTRLIHALLYVMAIHNICDDHTYIHSLANIKDEEEKVMGNVLLSCTLLFRRI